MTTTTENNVRNHRGGCHCGAVRFEAQIDASAATMCNCSICTKLGAVSSIVRPAAFSMQADPSALGEYRWGAQISTRYFCKRCGVYCFGKGHLEETGGDYVSINFNCLDDLDLCDVKLSYWDGRHNNWEAGPSATPVRR